MTVLLQPHLAYLRARGRKPATIDARYYWLTAADQARDPHGRSYFEFGIDEASTDEWVDFLAAQVWLPATRAINYYHCNGFYQWACAGDDPPLDWNPFAGIERPPTPHSLPDPVTDDELAQAVERSDDWWRLVVILAAEAGLRRAEIVKLRREDVTADRIRVRESKGGKSREVETTGEIWGLVADRGPGLLVRSQVRGVPISAHRLGMLARHHFDAIRLPDVHLHRFRHWFATTLIRRGVDISVVSVLMGHASVATTMKYVLITGEQRRLAIDTLPTLAGHPSEPPSIEDRPTLAQSRRVGRRARRGRITHP